MPIDKVVNSAKLEACLTAEANAIREKTGDTAGLLFDFENEKGFADAIADISGGLEPLDNPATAENIEVGYKAYDDFGNVIEGTFKPINFIEAKAGVMNPALSDICFVTLEGIGCKIAVIENTGGKSQSCTIYANEGYWVLATVTTRSATTYPDGWELLHESPSLGSDGSNQRMAFLCKKIDADGDVTFTVTQSESARIYINLIATSDADGFVYHEGFETINYDDSANIGTVEIERPDCNVVVWGCSADRWTSSAPYGTWHCDDLSPICLGGVPARQANFYDKNPGVETRTFQGYGSNASGCYVIDCVEMLLKE